MVTVLVVIMVFRRCVVRESNPIQANALRIFNTIIIIIVVLVLVVFVLVVILVLVLVLVVLVVIVVLVLTSQQKTRNVFAVFLLLSFRFLYSLSQPSLHKLLTSLLSDFLSPPEFIGTKTRHISIDQPPSQLALETCSNLYLKHNYVIYLIILA